MTIKLYSGYSSLPNSTPLIVATESVMSTDYDHVSVSISKFSFPKKYLFLHKIELNLENSQNTM